MDGKTAQRFIKFGLVGGSGILVNESVTGAGLFMFKDVLPVVVLTNVAVFLGWLLSVLTNFTLNYHWTWRDRKTMNRTPVLQKIGKYYASAATAWFVQASVVNTMAAMLGWSAGRILLYNLVGILFGMLANFLLADRWVFR